MKKTPQSMPEVITPDEIVDLTHHYSGVGSIKATQPHARPADKPKRPKVNDMGRVCDHPDCSTKLSIYNSQPMCHVHRPIRFPRVRGHQSN